MKDGRNHSLTCFKNDYDPETSLMVQGSGLYASTARGMGSIPGWGAKILHAMGHGQKEENLKNPNDYDMDERSLKLYLKFAFFLPYSITGKNSKILTALLVNV